MSNASPTERRSDPTPTTEPVERSALRFVDGALVAAAAGAACLVSDLLFFWVQRLAWPERVDALPAQRSSIAATYFGVAAPWALLVSLLFGIAALGSGHAIYRAPSAAWRWLWSRDGALGARAAGTVATTVGLAAFLGASWVVGMTVLRNVRTTSLAVALILCIQLVIAPVAGAGAMLLHRLLRPALSSPRATWASSLLPPGVQLFCMLGALVVLGARHLRTAATLSALPWTFAMSPFVGLVVGLALFGRWRNHARARLACALASQVGLAIAALPPMLGGEANVLNLIASQSGFASAWLVTARRLLDFDADGVPSLYAGQDCAPFDRTRSPLSSEVPNNGIDEDCSGRDLVQLEQDVLRPGRRGHARPPGLAARPHILLITTDGLSLANTGIGGSPRETTPNLDAWANRATVFTHAFAFAPSTYASLPALMTGTYATDVASFDLSRGIPVASVVDGADTLAVMLSKLGYRTVAILPNPNYFGDRGWKNLLQGFQVVEFPPSEVARTRSGWGKKIHSAPELTARAIREIQAASAPLFVWIHYYDHHVPYEPPPEWGIPRTALRSPLQRFEAEVAFADRHWGELLEAVEATWRPEEYIAIFTADHGEAFDDNHAERRHAYSLHTAELHVPLVIQTSAERGRRVTGLASSLDIVPTLSDLVPLRSKHRWRGESLVGALFHGAQLEKTFVVSAMIDSHQAAYGHEVVQRVGIRSDDWYFVRELDRGRQWLVRWQADPLERLNLTGEEPNVLERLRYTLARELRELRTPSEGPSGH